jgi:hypothetical protein
MAIIGGERPSTIQTTLASMQEEDDKQAIKVRNADLEARFVPPLFLLCPYASQDFRITNIEALLVHKSHSPKVMRKFQIIVSWLQQCAVVYSVHEMSRMVL